MNAGHAATNHHPRQLARVSLAAFLLTFIVARAFVFMIMAHEVPNFYFFMHGTHVHHLNYGIFLLVISGGFAVFRHPTGKAAKINAMVYGVAMALTFDEFGMWLHLGGSYWQRTSVDGVVIVAAVLALLGYARSIRKFEARHLWAFACIALAIVGFTWVVFKAGDKIGTLYGPRLRELEISSSP